VGIVNNLIGLAFDIMDFMKNKIFIAIGVIFVISALMFGIKANKVDAPAFTEETLTGATTTATSTVTPKSETKPTLSNTTWVAFEKYLGFAKAHDLVGIKSLSYQISPTCEDVTKTEECNLLMDNVYFFGKDLKEKDYTNIWSDSKQIILSTDFKRQEVGTTTVSYTRGIIYFTRDTQGNPKILSFNPDDGIFLNKSSYTPEELEARITNMTKDSDQDGLPDIMESCAEYAVEANCPNKKTNPNKRDTDGNGWWDSIEIFFKK